MSEAPRKCRLAIFSVSAGSGHTRAAQAIQSAAGQWFPHVDVVHVDLMDLVPRLFRTIYVDTCLKVAERHPAGWCYLDDSASLHHSSRGTRTGCSVCPPITSSSP